MNYLTQAGETVSLVGRPIGRGGEGQVLPVAGSPGLVAKIFHQPTQERWWKVALLLANPLPETVAYPSAVWPIDLLFTHTPQPKFAGYTMARAHAASPIYEFYGMAIRQAKHPGFDYRHLVRSARNLAAVVARAHQHGHVIGDLNESNTICDLHGVVRLLDVDSWQVADSSRGIVYPCGVGKGEFLAPELQLRNLARLVREPCHDNFALGVLIFKLLNEGTHPFAGVFHGRGDPPALEARIASGDFPYRPTSGRWTPQPLSIPFESLYPSLQQLFVQTFETGHTQPKLRPTATAWLFALAESEQFLHVCNDNPQHSCWTNECVWCERTARLGGLDPFPCPPCVKHRRVEPSVVPIQQLNPTAQHQAPPTVSSQPDWLPASLAQIVERISQQLALPPLVVTALAAGVTIAAVAVILTTLLRLLD